MTTIREVETPVIAELVRSLSPFLGKDDYKDGSGHFFVGSGKAALCLILKFLRNQNIFQSKRDELLVPNWLGFWVYNAINSQVFASNQLSKYTKGMMVYHQYGFPQDMDTLMAFAKEKGLVVIEDCAHVIDSSYKGKKLGSIGDFGLFSFSKFCFCMTLGGITTSFSDFGDFFDQAIQGERKLLVPLLNFAKVLSDLSLVSSSEKFKKISRQLLFMTYALYGESPYFSSYAKGLWETKKKSEIDARVKYYHDFRDRFDHLGLCDHLESTGVTPYVIPIIAPIEKLLRCELKLKEAGFATGIYNFDVNRNILNPSFQKCLWVLCGGAIPSNMLNRQLEIIKKAF